MCARYTLTAHEVAIKEAFLSQSIDKYKPDTNIAPTDNGLVIRADHPDQIHGYHFGLVPWHANDTREAYKRLNARSDNLLKGLWKPIMEKNRRCLVIADGFYEWEVSRKEKLPWRFTLKDRPIFCFAGLHSTWVNDKTKEFYRSFAIITTEPSELVGKFHDRMPVILRKDEEQQWLSSDVPLKDLVAMCDTYPDDEIQAYRVSKAVNSTVVKGVPNKGAELILPENSK
jgi:putative SOS response-associated peptidase YedK